MEGSIYSAIAGIRLKKRPMNLLVEETIEEIRRQNRPNYRVYFRAKKIRELITPFEQMLLDSGNMVWDESLQGWYFFILYPKLKQ